LTVNLSNRIGASGSVLAARSTANVLANRGPIGPPSGRHIYLS
jgi:hypothetical protein